MAMRIHCIYFLLLIAPYSVLFSCASITSYAEDNSQSPSITQVTGEISTTGGEINPPDGMTLYDLLMAGGWVMVILGALSILALALVIYFSITLTQRNLVPHDMVMQIRHFLRDRRYEDIARLSRRSKGMFSKIILAGVSRGMDDPASAASTMEAIGRREAESLMRKVRYLSDIATVSPMLGILGTVLGMIRAFNFIAFDISAVKPVALASAVAQALVTTAAGLIVAIPCMGFFFYFRGKLQSLVGEMEEVAVEISDQLTLVESKPKTTRKPRRKTNAKETRTKAKSSET